MSKQLNIFNDAANTWKKEAAEASARDYNFDTLSGERLGQLYYPAADENGYMEKLGFPGQYPYTRAFMQICIAASCGPCANFPVSAHLRKRMSAIIIY